MSKKCLAEGSLRPASRDKRRGHEALRDDGSEPGREDDHRLTRGREEVWVYSKACREESHGEQTGALQSTRLCFVRLAVPRRKL